LPKAVGTAVDESPDFNTEFLACVLWGLGAAALWCFSTLPRGSHGGKIERRGATSTGVWSVMLCLATPTAPRFILNVGSQGMTQGKRDDRTQGTSGG